MNQPSNYMQSLNPTQPHNYTSYSEITDYPQTTIIDLFTELLDIHDMSNVMYKVTLYGGLGQSVRIQEREKYHCFGFPLFQAATQPGYHVYSHVTIEIVPYYANSSPGRRALSIVNYTDYSLDKPYNLSFPSLNERYFVTYK
ncbi:hypothetical protein [RNA virus hoopoe/BBanka01/2015/HUN]|nr:hypothetical protein [RNA virus hoopoe/BBanka01/2015/HUN]